MTTSPLTVWDAPNAASDLTTVRADEQHRATYKQLVNASGAFLKLRADTNERLDRMEITLGAILGLLMGGSPPAAQTEEQAQAAAHADLFPGEGLAVRTLIAGPLGGRPKTNAPEAPTPAGLSVDLMEAEHVNVPEVEWRRIQELSLMRINAEIAKGGVKNAMAYSRTIAQNLVTDYRQNALKYNTAMDRAGL
jgi:hypothetical protein